MSETKTKKTKKVRKKISASKLIKNILAVLLVSGLTAALAVGLWGVKYIKDIIDRSPEFSVSRFTNVESTKIYAGDGTTLLANVGVVERENVSYDDIPQAFIDALVAVEDSRYFEHNGFDVPRFVKAMMVNAVNTVRTRRISFSQGASTLTMQLIRNVYFTDDETGLSRQKSIEYKIQQIYLALRTEEELNKKRIMELYLNRINFGASTTRGIQGAAEYYFGKDVSELSLSECAYLAGVINAPATYNAFKNYDKAVARRDTVLTLMANHGYITKEEADLAKSISLADQLITAPAKTNQYQAYINEVIDEVMTLTGQDPYTSSMTIYTYMDLDVQNQIEAIENGGNDSFTIPYPDDLMQVAIVCMDNQTGAVIGVGGGRGSIAVKGFSRVSDMKKQPGSSVKPFLSYALAFEYLGWSTQHMVLDEPVNYRGTHIQLYNFDRTYRGQVLLPEAVGRSLNVPAYNTLLEVIDSIGTPKVVEYLNSLGFKDITTDKFDLGYSIGGSSFDVTVMQMAAAHSALANLGYYVTPHTVKRIEFNDGSAPYEPTYAKTRVLSEESAYLVDTLMENDVSGPYVNYMQILKRKNYKVYAKTGTTNYDDTFVSLGIPNGSAKDKWMIASTSEYTTAAWIGYDSAVSSECYYTSAKSSLNIPGKVQSAMLDVLYRDHSPADIARPADVVSITHVRGVYPYASPIEGMDAEYVVTGLINKKNYKLTALEVPAIQTLTNFKAENKGIENATLTLSLSWDPYPYTESGIDAENHYIVELNGREYTCTALYNPAKIFGEILYKVNLPDGTTAAYNTNTAEATIALPGAATVQACGFYGYANGTDGNQVCAEINLAIDMTKQKFNSVSDYSSFMSTYNLNWKLKGVAITDSSSQKEGAIINVTSSPADLFSKSAVSISELQNASVTVEYYYKADDVTLAKTMADLEAQKKNLGFSGWTIRTTEITKASQSVGGIASIEGASVKLGSSYPYADLYKDITFTFYVDATYTLPKTVGELLSDASKYNYSYTITDQNGNEVTEFDHSLEISTINGSAAGSKVQLSSLANGAKAVVYVATPEPEPENPDGE